MGSRNSKGRMVYWKISYSKQLVRCSIFSQLLFTWLIPNVDDLGRMEGEPEIIKGMMFPYHANVSAKQIRESLKELSEEKLITWYKVGENLYIELPNFSIYQKLRNDRDYKSDYPPPSDSDNHCQDMTGQAMTSQLEEKRREEKRNIYTPEFEKWYKEWPNPNDKINSFKNYEKVRKQYGQEYIDLTTSNYKKQLKKKPTDYKYASNNFYGQKAYHSNFADPEKPKVQPGNIVYLKQESIMPPPPDTTEVDF